MLGRSTRTLYAEQNDHTRGVELVLLIDTTKRYFVQFGATNCQHQCCNNSAMALAILFSLKTMESLQNGVATHYGATALFSIRLVSLASSQDCHRVDIKCKRALKVTHSVTLRWQLIPRLGEFNLPGGFQLWAMLKTVIRFKQVQYQI